MNQVAQIIVTVASVITALGIILSAVLSLTKKYLENEKQDEDIKKIKEEQAIITTSVLACLKGIHELGANGPTTEAIHMIEEHLNKEAHK